MSLNLTPEQLANTPAAPPPPGVTPNFVDPETKTPGLIAAIVIVMTLMLVVLMATIYGKLRTIKRLGLDDWTAILGGVFNVATAGLTISLFTHGGYGTHTWDVPLLTFVTPSFYYRPFAIEIIAPWAAYFAKISILFFLDKIFKTGQKKLVHYLVYLGIAINTLFIVILTIYTGVQCAPRGSPALRPEKCTNDTLLEIGDALAVINVFMDLYVLALAVPIIVRLQMPRKKKIGSVLVLATGLVACGMSIATLYYRVVSSHDTDISWNECTTIILGVMESMVALITARLPATPMIWRYLSTKYSTSIRSLLSSLSLRSRHSQDEGTSAAETAKASVGSSHDTIHETEFTEAGKTFDSRTHTHPRTPTDSDLA